MARLDNYHHLLDHDLQSIKNVLYTHIILKSFDPSITSRCCQVHFPCRNSLTLTFVILERIEKPFIGTTITL